MLEMVGLGHRLKHKPRELSGGEMQRTAIARALVSRPQVLLADEPTGNLDVHTGEEIMEILRRLNREQNLTIVMVTHDTQIAAEADRTITLVDGRVVAAVGINRRRDTESTEKMQRLLEPFLWPLCLCGKSGLRLG